MPLNSLAPGFVKIHYSVYAPGVLTHVMVIPVHVVAFTGPTTQILPKSGPAILWTTAVNSFVTVLKAVYQAGVTSSTIDFADLYSQASPSAPPIFEDTTLLAAVGTGAGTAVAGQMDTFSFRTQAGGRARLVTIETIASPNVRQAYAALSVTNKAIVDYLLGTTSLFYGRDDTYLDVFLFHTTKYNDPVRKKRLGI